MNHSKMFDNFFLRNMKMTNSARFPILILLMKIYILLNYISLLLKNWLNRIKIILIVILDYGLIG